MIELQRILVPTDFSEPSGVAVQYAKALADAFGASIHVLHVMEDPFINAPISEGYVPPAHLFEEFERAARNRLDEVLTSAEQAKYRAKRVIKSGTPFVEIVRYAKGAEIDLIVMGTHGRGTIAHMLMGNVAEKVVRKAPCPVLTVRHPQHEFVMP
jgi:nucleotide-binding universal stress UspA family protein